MVLQTSPRAQWLGKNFLLWAYGPKKQWSFSVSDFWPAISEWFWKDNNADQVSFTKWQTFRKLQNSCSKTDQLFFIFFMSTSIFIPVALMSSSLIITKISLSVVQDDECFRVDRADVLYGYGFLWSSLRIRTFSGNTALYGKSLCFNAQNKGSSTVLDPLGTLEQQLLFAFVLEWYMDFSSYYIEFHLFIFYHKRRQSPLKESTCNYIPCTAMLMVLPVKCTMYILSMNGLFVAPSGYKCVLSSDR